MCFGRVRVSRCSTWGWAGWQLRFLLRECTQGGLQGTSEDEYVHLWAGGRALAGAVRGHTFRRLPAPAHTLYFAPCHV